MEQFRESSSTWLSSNKLDYASAKLSCTSCNSLNITCDGGGCTCSVCTGNFTILHGDQSNLTIVDWRGVKDDETKPVVRGWKNCEVEKKVRERTTSHRWRSQSKDSIALDVRNIDRTFRFTDVTTGQFNFSISRIRNNFKYLHKGAPRRRRSCGLNFTTTVSVFSLIFSRNSRFSSHFVVCFPEIQYLPFLGHRRMPDRESSRRW